MYKIIVCSFIFLIDTCFLTAQLNSISSSDDNLPFNFSNHYFRRDYRLNSSDIKDLLEKDKDKNEISNVSGVWTELNPLVPRVDYLGIHFVNHDVGWAVGEGGTIILSTDGGGKWKAVESLTTNLLLNIHSYNGLVVIATGYDGIILRSSDAGNTWQQVTSGVNGDLWKVQMINDTLGWICGLGPTLIKTTDGGLNWNPVSTGYISFQYWSLDFYDKYVGYIAGGDGNVLKTTDGGNSWQHFDISAVNPYSLYAIDVVNPNRVIVGGFARLAYTTNGGSNWNSVGISDVVNTIAFADSLVGYEGQNNGQVWKTTDGGITWQLNNWFPLYSKNWIMFVNDTLGYISGSALNIQKTTDKGMLWRNCIINDEFNDVYFINETTGWAVSDFNCYKTTDAGQSWIKQVNPPRGRSLFFINGITGFAGDRDTGRIYKTTDGGETWYLTNTSGIGGHTGRINFLDSLIGFATNSLILKTSDRGESWFTKLNVPFKYFSGICFTNDSTVWSVGGDTYPFEIYKSLDKGETWIPIPFNEQDQDDIYFVNEQIGFITALNELYKTTDGGINFQPDSTVTGIGGHSKFSNFLTQPLFIIGDRVYVSTNGGDSWIEYFELRNHGLKALSLYDVNKGYAVGDRGIILKYFDDSIPVELTNFSAVSSGNDAILHWSTATELNNFGFDIERSQDGVQFSKIAFVSGNGTTTVPQYYRYTDQNLSAGKYYYRLKQVDYNGSFSFSEIKSVQIYAGTFFLSQNYPNPFNPTTTISYSISANGIVSLKVYDILGNEIAELVNKYQQPGNYHISFNASNLPSGVYIYSLISNGNFSANKLIVIK